jgi:CheY-like chemotaxis protein/Tfp pilus assembly protein PilZ
MRPLLVVGLSSKELLDRYARSALRAGVEKVEAAAPSEVESYLEDGAPAAVALDMKSEGAEGACLAVRDNVRFAGLPVVGLIPQLDDLAFPEIYGWGGDDVIRSWFPDDLVPRLRGLPAELGLAPPAARGGAVIADGDRRRRILFGRILRNAGYSVRFAADPAEAQTAMGASPKLVVVDADLGSEGGVQVVKLLRAAGPSVPMVLRCPPKRLAAVRTGTQGLANIAVIDGFAPPENLLFVANDLQRAGTPDGRASTRLLYSTVVAFRLEGRDEDTFGCTYNVSGGGLYVRTLAPLAAGESAWIELRPPRCHRRVRLEGRVVWSRPFGPVGTATVPPGFAVQIMDGTSRDLVAYEAGYNSFYADTLNAT